MSTAQLRPSPFAGLFNGISRLSAGMEREMAPEAQRHAAREAEIRQAIRELSLYTERELAELGIAPGGIEDAVRYGRPGIER